MAAFSNVRALVNAADGRLFRCSALFRQISDLPQ
jgi:hypothetical protein